MATERIHIETSEIDLKDAQIFKAVFNMFYPRAYTFTLKLLQDEVVSADITQEAFLYMWEKAYCFPDLLAFKSYLYSCLKNKTLNYIRDYRVERGMQELKDVFVDEVDIDHLIIKQELKARILDEVNRLGGVKRDVILLRLEGYSYDEISEELGLSINTVKTHKKQAYKDLRIHLSDYSQYVLMLIVLLAICFC
ncbi:MULTISPECIES: sigma-70 family RNA polymerase sigma factor [Butyricimonas]|jgi:RNA polymerase sigma factor, sigma-70 family|uniref:Sigma-70 family RNA polymerase sigma factor n=1 Tax=Butyricimonas hominis TaxID=2763032 RepID=A0ABR7D0B3_9BACT|nr:sigma-70 family RNA polymerase sigma factor [Butyricimonas hominis]MBC5621274.1 sigma-70 family RNA polymerase sigma factor [Butyricimonas hominis]